LISVTALKPVVAEATVLAPLKTVVVEATVLGESTKFVDY
jgi:hypothetical protein